MPVSAEVLAACKSAARKYKVPLPTVIGIVRQESAGQFLVNVVAPDDFKKDNGTMPIMRHEGHYLNKRLTGDERTLARKLGLASSKAGAVKNPSKQQARFDRLFWPAARISRPAEIESCSWSGPQVMGAHWKKLGFKSAEDMLQYMRKGVTQGVDVMMRYCDKFGLIDEMQRGDIEGFVRGYNGKGNVANYSRSIRKFIAQALAEYGTATNDKNIVAGVPVTNKEEALEARTYLRMGIYNDARVREAQELLSRFGYAIDVDGDFGPTTRDVVKKFQRDHKLTVDGKIGPETWAALNTRRLDPEEQPGIPGPAETLTKTDEGKQGAVIAGSGAVIGGLQETKDSVQTAADSLSTVAGVSTWIDYAYTGMMVLAVILTIAGVSWYIYGYFKARRIDKSALDPTPDEPMLASLDPLSEV